LAQRKYEGRDGVERTVIEMPSVDKVHFCGPKQQSGQASTSYAPTSAEPSTAPKEDVLVDDDDLPF